jgi:hypothetical protein
MDSTNTVTPIRSGTKATELRFRLPGGKVAKVPYVDEARNYVDELVASAIGGAIEMMVNGCEPHRVEDILRLARDRMAAEKERMRFTSYTGEEVRR